MPSYLMSRMTGRSTTTKVMMTPPRSPFSVSRRDVVEAVGVPKRHEVAAQGLFVVDVAGFGDDDGAKGVLRNAAGAAKLDGLDDVGGDLRSGGGFPGIDGLRGLELRRRGREGPGEAEPFRPAARSQTDWRAAAGAPPPGSGPVARGSGPVGREPGLVESGPVAFGPASPG